MFMYVCMCLYMFNDFSPTLSFQIMAYDSSIDNLKTFFFKFVKRIVAEFFIILKDFCVNSKRNYKKAQRS